MQPFLSCRANPLNFLPLTVYFPVPAPPLLPESVAYEWSSKPGLIRYYYHTDRRPDTRTDILSFGFITALADAVMLRIDSDGSNDYIEVEIVSARAQGNSGLPFAYIGDVYKRPSL